MKVRAKRLRKKRRRVVSGSKISKDLQLTAEINPPTEEEYRKGRLHESALDTILPMLQIMCPRPEDALAVLEMASRLLQEVHGASRERAEKIVEELYESTRANSPLVRGYLEHLRQSSVIQ